MECLTSLATEAISKLGALVVESTVKQFKYMIRKDKIIVNLKEEHKKLKAMKANLQGIVDAYGRNGHEIGSDVQEWLHKVEAVDNELERLYENEAKKGKKCFGVNCPDLAFNYSVGKQATKKAQDIASLKEEENKFKLIPYPKSPPRLGSLITEDIKALKSRKAISKNVMEKLKDERIKRISICGMGGVGKTTLVNEVIQNIETTPLFDKVVMAVVSQKPDYEKIQIQIADRLCLKFRGKSMQERALELHESINGDNDRVLIVLDDVWDELDFRCIGLPSLEHQKGCKILFTSRNAKVCQKMGSQEDIIVPVLSEDEAWYLFREMAGDVVDLPNIYRIAKEVAKECGGLPLALVTVARALGKEEKPMWENALEQLRNSPSSSFSDVQKLVYSRIEHSVNFLSSDEQKCCLLLCGLFPEDFDIPIESLLRLGMGLGVFKVDGVLRKTRNLVHTFIGHLKRCFLLLDSHEPECVKMHDVVRDVVISIASKAQYGLIVQDNAELKSPKEGNLDHIKAISLLLDEIKGLKNSLEYPELQLLQVHSKSKEPNPWPEHFFQGMNMLKVLAMENLSIPTLPSLFQASANLHTLQVEHCDVGDISVIGKELKRLEVLSFAHSNIKELPTEIGELGFLKLLDLTGCDDLYFISTNVLRRLSRLEELYFWVQNFPWAHHKDVLMELQSISNHLKVVEFKVRKVEILPKDFTFKHLERFGVYVVPDFGVDVRLGYLESSKLVITYANSKSMKCSSMMKELVKKCETLNLIKVKDLKNVFYELDDSEPPFACLKDLRIYSCPNLEYLVNGIGPSTAFLQIQSLSLQYLINLREICNVSDQYDNELTIKFLNLVELKLESLPCLTGFSNAIDLNESTQPIKDAYEIVTFTVLEPQTGLSESAKSMMVGDGQMLPKSYPEPRDHKLLPVTGKLFSTKWMQQFPKLENLELRNCASLAMIFDMQGNSQLNGQSIAVFFPQLKKIKINNLGNLTHVWGNAPNNVQGFQNLRSLVISCCESLRHAFTPAIVRAITNLEKLEVKDCKLMENLVVGSKDEEEGDYKEKGETKIVFDRLDSLTLEELPKIASICPKSYELELPSIRELTIEDCPELNISSLLNQACSKHNNVTVTSGLNNFKENHSRTATWNFGCIPLCSKFIRQGDTNEKNDETILLPHDYVLSNSERKINLEELYVSNCELRDESYQQDGDQTMIRHVPTIDGYLFPKLTSLNMQYCNKIRVLLSLPSFRSLECLEKLKVAHCENIEEIISQDENKASANKILLPRLQDVIFDCLPNLKAFYQGSHLFDFPSLRKVRIENCPNMEVFSRVSLYTPVLDDLKMIGLYISNCIHKGDLNTAIQGFKAFVELRELEMLRWNSKGIFKYFISIVEMDITKFHKLLKLVPFNEIHMLQNMKELTIKECDSLAEVFESEGGMIAKKGYASTHYEIERMSLVNLPKLRDIWGPNIMRHVSFNKLTMIRIERCDSLKSVLSHSMAKCLVQLTELSVRDCEIMEQIVTKEDEIMDNKGSKVKTLFPKLLTLKLISLPKLDCICSIDYGYDIPLCDEEEEDKEINDKLKVQISFPQLQHLILADLPSLKCFCPGAYDYDPMPSSNCMKDYTQVATFPNGNISISIPNLHVVFQSESLLSFSRIRTMGDVNLTIHYIKNSEQYKEELQKLETFRCLEQRQYQHLLAYIMRIQRLELESCHKLLSCVPSNMICSFQHLLDLRVEQCGCLEEIFEPNDYEEMALRWLELHSLAKLKHIWGNPGSMSGFQYLWKLMISECHDLKFVFPDASVARSLPILQHLEVRNCNKMEEIIPDNNANDSIPKGAKIIFPNLMEIRLSMLPRLDCFCPSFFHFELPRCHDITIEECPKMENFCYGTLFTPDLYNFYVEGREFNKEKDVNEGIQEMRGQ